MNHILQTKVNYSIDLIRRAESTDLRYRPEGFFVAFSGGKDSQVLLDLVQRAEVRYTAQKSSGIGRTRLVHGKPKRRNHNCRLTFLNDSFCQSTQSIDRL